MGLIEADIDLFSLRLSGMTAASGPPRQERLIARRYGDPRE